MSEQAAWPARPQRPGPAVERSNVCSPRVLETVPERATIPSEAASRHDRRLRRPHEREGGGMARYEAYCVKCREKREFEGEEVTLKNGRRAAQGKCPVCGTKVMRILGKSA